MLTRQGGRIRGSPGVGVILYILILISSLFDIVILLNLREVIVELPIKTSSNVSADKSLLLLYEAKVRVLKFLQR